MSKQYEERHMFEEDAVTVKALEVCDLSKDYRMFSLKRVAFELPKGYIMGFIGPNGSGKTTTIKSILGMTSYQSGTIKVFGLDNKEHMSSINERIGVVMDAPQFVEEWTMTEVEKAVAPFYTRWSSHKYSVLLEGFGIEKAKRVKELSRGMKVKLMMAVALAHDPDILILDEPTSGLDPIARDELCGLLSAFVVDESKSILFSTHITADLERIADYVTFILDGQIVYSGSKEDLLEKYAVVKGGLRDLKAEHSDLVIGLREYGTGFEGMVEVENINKFSKDLLVEPATLDEILIFMNKGVRIHE